MALSTKAKKYIKQLGDTAKMGDIKKCGKEIKIDHDLGLELWSQGDYHPRLLAALIFDKTLLDQKSLTKMGKDLEKHEEFEGNYISDWLLANQLTKDKKLIELMESWENHSTVMLRRWFWYHQGRLRWMGRKPPPENTADLLKSLEKNLDGEDPRVQWAMNFCAAWIGIFETKYRARVVKLGKAIGLYKEQKVPKNCTPNYLPEFIRIESAKRDL